MGVDGCQIDNKLMQACLHRYLERDFSLIEELLKRPPYTQNGHILIEEIELENMCQKMFDLKQCYENMIMDCVAYEQYSHMKRIIKTLRSLYNDLCGQSFLIRYLIEGGYCIEYARQESICLDPDDNDNNHNNNNSSSLPWLPIKQRWPLSLASMLRFEVGKKMCPYLINLNDCLIPFIQRRCRNPSRELWNTSMKSLLDNWCDNFSNGVHIQVLSFQFKIILITFYILHSIIIIL